MAEARRLGGPGYDLVERVLRCINRHSMLRGGEKVVVAVSGGADSTCLLDILERLAAKLDLELIVAHVDHGLSDASAAVAARVAEGAARRGHEVHMVRAPDLAGPNLQARARGFRYGFLDLVVEREDAQAIATGHTLDDRVETTLARLIHGASTEGLAGIPPHQDRRIRPLIEVPRTETRAYCAAVGLEFHDDPANEDLRYDRVAVRRLVLGPIRNRWGEGAMEAIARSAQKLSEDAIALSEIAARLQAAAAQETEDGTRLELDVLLPLSRALRRRVLELTVGRVRDRAGGIEAALDALDAEPPSTGLRFDLAGGAGIRIEADHLVVTAPRR